MRPTPRHAGLLLACVLAGCGPAASPAPPPPALPAAVFEGHYANGSQQLDIERHGDGYWLQIQDDGPGACAFSGAAIRLDERLLASLQDWKSGAVLTVRHAGDGGVELLSEQEDDRFSLSNFCRGGATLSGHYRPRPAP